MSWSAELPPSSDHARGGIPRWWSETAANLPLYRGLPPRGWPAFCHLDDDLVDAVARYDDPFAGRAIPEVEPAALLQATSHLPVYWALGQQDLDALARSLSITWTRLGVGKGERVVLYDYSTSPLVAFASRSFLPHLEHGAADLIACTPICNDGLPELADRCVHILEYANAQTLFIDSEAVEPLLKSLGSRRPAVQRVVVSRDESPISRDQLVAWSERFGVQVAQLLRSDLSLFHAYPCPRDGRVFHPPPPFVVEPVDGGVQPTPEGRLSVTNLAVRSTVVVRYVTPFWGRVEHESCGCGSNAATVVIA